MMAATTVPDNAVQVGWERLQSHFGFLLGVQAVMFAVMTVFSVFTDIAEDGNGWLEFLVGFVSYAVHLLLEMGFILVCLKIIDSAKPEFADLIARLDVLWSYIGASLIVAVLVVAGLVLLIVPGIYVGVRFQFFGFFIVDDGIGPLDSMQRSWEVTEGRVWSLLWLDLILFGINLLGMLLFLVGLFVTVPISTLALAYVYRQLLASTPEEGIEPAPSSA